ncbi:MAG TPA: hypothetical protein VFA52_02040 [Candidatus Paceibacterota bacterium]|nr:hypothetical protein [Candidatus Paceibacterota bacterium]
MNIDAAIAIIQWPIGITMLVFGIHQMSKPAEWFKFLPAWVSKISPIKNPATEMRIHSLGNIIFGLFLMFPFGAMLVAAWIAFIWWLTIVPFAWRVDWALGMRDLCITLALGALIFLL